MAIDFPNSPTNGQVYSVGTKSWTYVSAENKWVASGAPQGPTGPTGPIGPSSTGPTGATGPTGPLNIPISGAEKTTTYVLVASDVGKYIQVGTGGSVTIPNNIFAQGDAVTIANNTGGNITINCSTTNAYITGVNTNRGSVTLATRGIASVLFLSATSCLIGGNVT
jgi:hypothetical protein